MNWFNVIYLISLFVNIYTFDIRSHLYNAVEYSVCAFRECCSKIHIPGNFDELEKTLHERVYGQHLVYEAVNALRSHWDEDYKPKKALTLSFHGWPGGGKNYVSKFIAEHLFSKGTKSKFVHQFVGRIHFSREDHVETYKNELYHWIKGNSTSCGQQLFIFDEVDKMPSQLLNAIKPMIDYRDYVDGVDYTRNVFIFLSNTGESLINSEYLKFWKSGRKRDDLMLSDFENLIMKGVFNEKGGFHQSDTIKSNLIDHYIPFLPMERPHVRLCILDEFRLRGIPSPKESHIEAVLETIEWGPSSEQIFSKTGCKRISQKVGLLALKHYDKSDFVRLGLM